MPVESKAELEAASAVLNAPWMMCGSSRLEQAHFGEIALTVLRHWDADGDRRNPPTLELTMIRNGEISISHPVADQKARAAIGAALADGTSMITALLLNDSEARSKLSAHWPAFESALAKGELSSFLPPATISGSSARTL